MVLLINIKRKGEIKNMVCEYCGEEKNDVEYVVNPYIEDVCNEDLKEWICDECYDKLVEDI